MRFAMRKPKRTERRRRHKTSKARRARAQLPAKWSADVTRKSNALDLEPDTFKGSPGAIAGSLKRSAEASSRRKSEPYRSAMSMLSFYINRAGSRLSEARRGVLERAKVALRRKFGRA
jgi:hypothetical protein